MALCQYHTRLQVVVVVGGAHIGRAVGGATSGHRDGVMVEGGVGREVWEGGRGEIQLLGTASGEEGGFGRSRH